MSHTAELIAVGTELLLGNIANTDAQMISQGLSELGINVFYHTVVGDNPERVRQAVDIAKKRADILITTGGLGPTCDDLTKVALAQAFGRKLFYHEPSAQRIRDRFAAMGRPVTENNYQQAMIPEGATVLDNDWGTAPGVAFAADGVHVIMLPGPPRECEMMFQHRAVPYLRGLSDGVIASRTVKTFGIGESAAESVLRDLMNALHNPTLAPYAKPNGTELRITAHADTEAEALALIAPVEEQVKALMGHYVIGVDVDSLEAVCFSLLQAQGLTLGTAESCTGGLIAKLITDRPGSSAIFRGGIVSYTNAVKHMSWACRRTCWIPTAPSPPRWRRPWPAGPNKPWAVTSPSRPPAWPAPTPTTGATPSAWSTWASPGGTNALSKPSMPGPWPPANGCGTRRRSTAWTYCGGT